jgi:hypothetical protein
MSPSRLEDQPVSEPDRRPIDYATPTTTTTRLCLWIALLEFAAVVAGLLMPVALVVIAWYVANVANMD